ncbi:MAG: hypothetical protein ACXW19_01660, partial [Thermoanaerobaculia bacterium]
LALIGLSFLVFLLFVAPHEIHSDQLVALEKARTALDSVTGPQLRGEIRTREEAVEFVEGLGM